MIGLCFFCPFLTSSAGIYYLEFFDAFIANIPLSFGTFLTYYLFVYVFRFSEFEKESEKYTGEKAPKWVEIALKSKVLLVVLVANLFFRILNQVNIF